MSTLVTIGVERTDTQDFMFGMRQLTDVAAKALSPGVNDPTTAIHALGHTSALLCEIAGHDQQPVLGRDGDGQVRVVWDRPTFAQVLDEAVSQPRRYGAADPAVLLTLMTLLREVAWVARREEQRAAVRRQLHRLQATASEADTDPAEEQQLTTAAAAVTSALTGTWTSTLLPRQ